LTLLLVVDKQVSGVSVRNLPGFMGWQAEVKFDQGWTALERAMERAIPVLCAYQVGSCQAVFDMSVEYSQTREQFGVPIGRFQRVQDHIVRLVNHLDTARWTTYEALWKLDCGHPATASVHMAKAVTAEAHMEACNAAHEVHAGVSARHMNTALPRILNSRARYSTISAIQSGTSATWPPPSPGNRDRDQAFS
jgi:alkylation response protein AidB-like acyl-CoA dehydrogenase